MGNPFFKHFVCTIAPVYSFASSMLFGRVAAHLLMFNKAITFPPLMLAD